MNRTPHAPAVHTCLAVGCQVPVPMKLLMCMEHWRLVPAAERRRVWAAYQRLGREAGAEASHRTAVKAAVDAVHGKQMAKKAKRDTITPDLF